MFFDCTYEGGEGMVAGAHALILLYFTLLRI